MPPLAEIQRPDDWRLATGSALASGRAVVVGFDGADSSGRALARAAVAAGAEGCVFVVTARPPAHWSHAEDILDTTLRDSASLLDEAINLLDEQGVPAYTRAVEGDPAEALIETARDAKATVIIVGARGGSYLERALRGSVAERVIARAPCDVLVVR